MTSSSFKTTFGADELTKLQISLAKRVICWYRRICINSTVAMEMFIALHRWWSTQNLHNELQVGNFPSRLNGTLEWELMGQKPGNQPQKDSHLFLHYFQSLMFADVHNYFLNQSGRPENDTCLQNEKHLDCKTDVFLLSNSSGILPRALSSPSPQSQLPFPLAPHARVRKKYDCFKSNWNTQRSTGLQLSPCRHHAITDTSLLRSYIPGRNH